MAAPTGYYADYAAGNDYSGAAFADGAFANATLTLTKAGAFASSQVNHWLYLTDNGSGEVTVGYYRITNIAGAPNAVVLNADIRSGANDPTDVVCAQHTGAIALPFRSLQGALDLITRDAVNGDQVNIKAATAQTLAAALVLTVYGAPTDAAPLVFRGYTAAENDGGEAEVACVTYALFASNSLNDIGLVDIYIHQDNAAAGISLIEGQDRWLILNCRINRIQAGANWGRIISVDDACIITNSNIQGYNGGQSVVRIGLYSVVAYCVIDGEGPLFGADQGLKIIGNVILPTTVGFPGISVPHSCIIVGNTIYSSVASTSAGIDIDRFGGDQSQFVANNIVEGFSGIGGIGISAATVEFPVTVIGNAFYNCTTNMSLGDSYYEALNDVLGSSPFTNAAGGDFSINGTQAGVTEDAFPTSYLGISTANLGEKGASQAGAGAGGGMLQANKRGNKQ